LFHSLIILIKLTKPPLPSILAPMKTSYSAKSLTPTLRALANFWSVSIEGLVIADWLQFYHCVIGNVSQFRKSVLRQAFVEISFDIVVLE